MKHQVDGLRFLQERPTFAALGAEQGTGKTWMLLADAEQRFNAGDIKALLVVAPKGVHVNWVIREIPRHLEVAHESAFWLSGASKRHKKWMDKVFRVNRERLAIFAINVDAVNTKSGQEAASRFLRMHGDAMLVVDESQRIKNPSAKRTRRAMVLGEFAKSRRISSGTLVANSPLDLFSQYQFLANGLLGTTSYRAFVSEYADLLPPGHPLVAHVSSGRGAPQIVRRDEATGMPVFKNIEKLQQLIAPHTFRVLKKDCLDLPEKIYQTQYFDLAPAQQRLYEQVKEQMRYAREDGEVDIFTALTLINKLRQLTSGFIMVDGEATELKEHGPRLTALKETVADAEGSIIIWASYREEIRQIVAALKDTYSVVEYHGGVKSKDRETAVDAFQSGDAKIFVANPAAGGTGLTLHAAQTVIYHSCSFSLEERKQSEDRAHRIGTRHNVVYIDLVARGTIDERIAEALQTKAGIATQILDGGLS